MPVHSSIQLVSQSSCGCSIILAVKLTRWLYCRCLTVPLWAAEVRFVFDYEVAWSQKKKKRDENVQEEKLAIFIFTRQRKCTCTLPVPSGRDIRINNTWSEIQRPFLLWKCLVGFVRGGGISPLTCVCLCVQQGNTVQEHPPPPKKTTHPFVCPLIHSSIHSSIPFTLSFSSFWR